MLDDQKESLSVFVPFLNPNEPEARLVALHVAEGQRVSKGDLLCSLETTKSVADITAETGGFIIGLHHQIGVILHAGEIFCYLAYSAKWKPLQTPTTHPSEVDNAKAVAELPHGLRITQPGLELARKYDLNLSALPIGPLITEMAIRKIIDPKNQPPFALADSHLEPNAILIYGGGGHGKSLIDLLRALGTYQVIGIIDDSKPSSSQVMELPILGGSEALEALYQRGVRLAVNAVGGIGDIQSRIKVFDQLAGVGFSCPTLVHPTAFVEPSAQLADGVQVMPHAYVGSEARIGFGVIINTGAIVSHDCLIGDYANLSPGAMLAGGVKIGAGTLVGMGVTIHLQVCVGEGARIGNSATVKRDVPPNRIVRAGCIWPD
jgi:sugar O-acyltransferase (sialic acid O-acetyltransferase NeuD family)